MEINRKTLPLLIITVFVVLGGFLYWNNQINKQNKSKEGVKVGDSVADFDFQDVEGKTFSFGDFKGKLLIIDFMAPWCSPCKEQIQVLREINEMHDVNIVTINVDPRYDQAFLQDFKKDYQIKWNFAHSPEAGIDYEINAVPSILLVDKEGTIVYRDYYTSLMNFEQLFEKYG
jgi:thiol-disulfide isomerase/thioredoxin